MQSTTAQSNVDLLRTRAGIGALIMLLASAMAGCGGGWVTEYVEPEQEPATFNLQATAHALFTEGARYEAHTVGTTTPSVRLLLDIQPSAEVVAVGAEGRIFEPRSVNWKTTLHWGDVAATVSELDAAFNLNYRAAVSNGSYDIGTGIIDFFDGAIDGYPFKTGDFTYLRPVLVGGWKGEHNASLAGDVKLYDIAGSGALVAMAMYTVRVTPVASVGSLSQAWFCFESNYYEPSRYRQQAYETQSYCWLIGLDGRPLGPFRANMATADEELKFEGGRL